LLTLGGVGCSSGPSGESAGPPTAAETTAGGSEIAARVAGRTITLAELDAKAKELNPEPYQQLYDARKSTLDQMIADALIEKAATERGASREQLLADEVTKKVQPVTDADVSAFYTQNQNRMGGRTLDQVKDQIQSFLVAQQQQKAQQEFLAGLKRNAEVQIVLEPPRVTVEVAQTAPTKGPATAPIQIHEVSDFQ